MTTEFTLLDRCINFLSPVWSMKRQIARRRVSWLTNEAQQRGFDGVSGDRLHNGSSFSTSDADSFIASGAEALRNHIRSEEFNNPFVSGPIRRLTNNIIGSGFTFQSRIKAEEIGRSEKVTDKIIAQIERGHKIWAKQAHMRLIHTWGELAWLAQAALLRDGAVIAVGHTSNRPGRFIPYCQQLYEVDRLRTPPGELMNERIRNGVRYDSEGVPEAYFMLKRHPGDSLTMPLTYRDTDYEEIPAFFPNGTRKVMYLFDAVRPEQLLGYSQFASGVSDLQNHKRYWEAEIMAMLEDACMVGIIESPMDALSYWSQDQINSKQVHEFAPNKWIETKPGQTVKIREPSRQNSIFTDVLDHLMTGPANALDTPPEVLLQDWKGMNYSNARTVLLGFYLSCRIRQRYMAEHYYEPTHEAVLFSEIANGKIKLREDGGLNFYSDPQAYLECKFIPPGWQWVDPVKEAQGKKIETDNNFDTHDNVASGKGLDIDEIIEANARYLKKVKAAEIKHGIEFPKDQDMYALESSEEPDAKDDKKPALAVVKGGKQGAKSK